MESNSESSGSKSPRDEYLSESVASSSQRASFELVQKNISWSDRFNSVVTSMSQKAQQKESKDQVWANVVEFLTVINDFQVDSGSSFKPGEAWELLDFMVSPEFSVLVSILYSISTFNKDFVNELKKKSAFSDDCLSDHLADVFFKNTAFQLFKNLNHIVNLLCECSCKLQKLDNITNMMIERFNSTATVQIDLFEIEINCADSSRYYMLIKNIIIYLGAVVREKIDEIAHPNAAQPPHKQLGAQLFTSILSRIRFELLNADGGVASLLIEIRKITEAFYEKKDYTMNMLVCFIFKLHNYNKNYLSEPATQIIPPDAHPPVTTSPANVNTNSSNFSPAKLLGALRLSSPSKAATSPTKTIDAQTNSIDAVLRNVLELSYNKKVITLCADTVLMEIKEFAVNALKEDTDNKEYPLVKSFIKKLSNQIDQKLSSINSKQELAMLVSTLASELNDALLQLNNTDHSKAYVFKANDCFTVLLKKLNEICRDYGLQYAKDTRVNESVARKLNFA